MHHFRRGFPNLLAKIGRRLLPREERPYIGESFSRAGEDRVLFQIFRDRNPHKCFYVDVGAMHPFRFSNTALFDRLGWHGVVIEPNSRLARLHQRFRPRASVIAEACSDQVGTVELITFPGRDALSTIDAEFAQLQTERFMLPESRRVSVPCRPLSQILAGCHIKQKITFLDVDVEGHDLAVLESNDWAAFRPEAILIEVREQYGPINQFLCNLGYNQYGHMGLNSIYLDKYT